MFLVGWAGARLVDWAAGRRRASCSLRLIPSQVGSLATQRQAVSRGRSRWPVSLQARHLVYFNGGQS